LIESPTPYQDPGNVISDICI